MLLTIWLPCHCALSPFQCLLLLIANGTQGSLRKNYLLWDHNAWLHLCLGGQQCLSSNKHLRNKQLWYRAQKSGMENSYLQKNTELSPSGFIILPKSWADLPSDFRVSNSHLLIYFCLLEFLNNFVDMCPNSCTLCHLNKSIWNLCLTFPAPSDCSNNHQLTAHHCTAVFISQVSPTTTSLYQRSRVAKVHEINMAGGFKKLAERY